ncbi:unnamed protein product [Moneuplotes crassus]|uniref:Uncharacterized protein n=1 Tax=Euplotes crassus TaxID=5936 RepID=A0AAD1XJ84_EUPCR|nr:unnamed protein product [Moneuplotes crassus]
MNKILNYFTSQPANVDKTKSLQSKFDFSQRGRKANSISISLHIKPRQSSNLGVLVKQETQPSRGKELSYREISDNNLSSILWLEI